MKSLHRAQPEDLDAAVLYADSLLQLRPRTVSDDLEIVKVLEGVLHRQPDHVGANHLYIHAVEGTSSPERGLASATRLETLVPAVGHLLHMPSHIYMRTGAYDAALAGNRRAAAADLAFLRANPPGHDGAMYYLHDVESLAVAAGFTGRFAEARQAALEIARVEAELAGEPIGKHFSGPLAMTLLRFQKWSDVEGLPVPPEHDAPGSFLSRFARAVALAAEGHLDRARVEREGFERAGRAIPADAYYRSNPMKYTLTTPDGRDEVLLDVPKYDFNWQLYYELQTPRHIPAGSKVTVVTLFDNSPKNPYNPAPDKEVFWSEQSWDEMYAPQARITVDSRDLRGSKLTETPRER